MFKMIYRELHEPGVLRYLDQWSVLDFLYPKIVGGNASSNVETQVSAEFVLDIDPQEYSR